MIKVMFVCLGNICRSPMAEFLFKDYVAKRGQAARFFIASAATSDEEEGNGVHRGTRRVLDGLGIDCSQKHAVQLKRTDYEMYDYFIGMDESNRRNMRKIFGGDKDNKVSLMLDYTDHPRDVADPWYTGDFETTYQDICRGIAAFYEYLQTESKI